MAWTEKRYIVFFLHNLPSPASDAQLERWFSPLRTRQKMIDGSMIIRTAFCPLPPCARFAVAVCLRYSFTHFSLHPQSYFVTVLSTVLQLSTHYNFFPFFLFLFIWLMLEREEKVCLWPLHVSRSNHNNMEDKAIQEFAMSAAYGGVLGSDCGSAFHKTKFTLFVLTLHLFKGDSSQNTW